MVRAEDWTVAAVAGDQVTLDYIRHNLVDTAYVPYTSAGTVGGTVVRSDGAEMIVAFASAPEGDRWLKGLLLSGDTAAYLVELDPPKLF